MFRYLSKHKNTSAQTSDLWRAIEPEPVFGDQKKEPDYIKRKEGKSFYSNIYTKIFVVDLSGISSDNPDFSTTKKAKFHLEFLLFEQNPIWNAFFSWKIKSEFSFEFYLS